ncbi:MAG: hypothetical protein ICV59_06640 [Thermoleophilia bacterium]|nr:hypothetical protein [Thermoleophilia bacterium]
MDGVRVEVDGFATFTLVAAPMIAAAWLASPWAALGFLLSAALFPLLAWLTYRDRES